MASPPGHHEHVGKYRLAGRFGGERSEAVVATGAGREVRFDGPVRPRPGIARLVQDPVPGLPGHRRDGHQQNTISGDGFTELDRDKGSGDDDFGEEGRDGNFLFGRWLNRRGRGVGEHFGRRSRELQEPGDLLAGRTG